MSASELPPRRERLAPLAILAELTYPEYRSRHLFTARLRLLIFIGFWFFYVIGFGEQGAQATPISAIVIASFAVTCIAYYNIMNDRWLIPSFLFEIVGDLVGLCVVVFLTGGIHSEYFFVFAFYCLLAGLFYGHEVAFFVAMLSFAAYAAFVGCSLMGWIPAPHIATMTGIGAAAIEQLHHPNPIWQHPYWGHFTLLTVLLALAVYAVKIAHNFTLLRERMLETRNRELQALQQISGTVRSAAPLEEVVDRVLKGVLDGLSFSGALLMLIERGTQRIVCYPPKNHAAAKRAEASLGFSLRELFLPIENEENQVFRQLRKKRVVFRNDLAELMIGVTPHISAEQARALQSALGVRKVIVIPLVAEEEVLGALIGFSQEAFVSERVVATLEAFANQGALALQTTMLIEELRRKNVELEEANRVKSEFLATMSHELRTPLTAIIGFSELLLEGVMGELTEEQQDSLREVLNNGANLLALINNLLDLAKMESGRFALVYEKFDLRHMLDRTTRTLGSLIKRKQLRFINDYPTDMPPIVADERRLQQVILNLVGNAIKFTPEGGDIRLEARYCANLDALPAAQRKQYVKDRAALAAGFFLVQVSDTGIGIPTGHLQTIFDMFKQVDSSVTRSYEGTGLGLALAKQLVELHRGTIWAESEENAGARFICLLPVTPPVPAMIEVTPPTATEPPRPVMHPVRVPM